MMMAHLVRGALLAVIAASFVAAAACGSPKLPGGPAPEYEDPHKPSFVDGSMEAPREVTPQTDNPGTVITDGGTAAP